MKIVLVGSIKYWNALEKYYLQHLRVAVDNIVLFPFPDIIRDHYSKNVFRKISYKLGMHSRGNILNANNALIQQIKKEQPDIVWIFKGTDILPETLSKIKDQGIIIVNYNPDHPFMRTFRSSGGDEIENCVPLYDLHLCYSKEIMKEIEIRYGGNVKTHFLPFGFELTQSEFKKVESTVTGNQEVNKLCFVGNADNEIRLNLVKTLIDKRIALDIYGYEWKKYLKGHYKTVNIFNGVSNIDFWITMRKYRLQLNIFRPHNVNSHNMRSFEIPAVGGIQLAPDTIEHRELFINGKEIFLYRNVEELIQKSEQIMALPKSEAEYLRNNSRNRCLDEDYSYKRRAKDVITIFRGL